MTDFRIRRATREDIPALAEVLARAYADDPLIGWYVQGRDRARRLHRFFQASITPMITNRLREVLTTDAREGVAFWAAPGTCAVSPLRMLRSLPGVLIAARAGLIRSARAYRTLQARHPPEPHWYLETIATHPDAQGRGIATALMKPILERCDADGIAAVLETQLQANVGFYERRGFSVAGNVSFPGGPQIWLMHRGLTRKPTVAYPTEP